MNKTFKTVWNRVRRAYVAVNETVSSTAQSAGPTLRNGGVSVSQSGSLRRTALALAVGSALALSIGSAHADVTFPGGCASVGGTMKDGVCYIGDGTQTSTVIEAVNDNWTNTGELTIAGGSGVTDYGIEYLAFKTGSTGKISNEDAGTLTIRGGSGNGSGIKYIACDGGQGTLTNTGDGTLTIQGGSNGRSSGIEYLVSKTGSMGTISNTGEGDLKILGGDGGDGIAYIAVGGGTGTISNTGKGTLTIQGGSNYGQGIYYFVSSNSCTGTLTNTGEGTLTIQGGSNSHGIQIFADGGKGTISNTGEGTLTIRGGSGGNSNGIGKVSNDSGDLIVISNTGKGTLTIQGSSSGSSNGIGVLADNIGVATISNDINGTLNILGNTETGSYGINVIAGSSQYFGVATGSVSNAGIMNLNAYAIKDFGSGIASVTNKSTGTVNAEAGAIFQNEGFSIEKDLNNVTVVTEDSSATVTVDNYGTASVTGDGWVLKDDWANHSVWEDGGELNITDFAEGTIEADFIRDSFETQFGTGTTLSFTGEGGTQASSAMYDTFTMDVVNQLIAEGDVVDGSVITSEVLDSENNAFSLGSSGTLDMSIGFKGIENSSSVTIDGGHTLTLTGDKVASSADFDLLGGAPITITNGTLQLGLEALTDADQYKGSIIFNYGAFNIGENSIVNVVAGEFSLIGSSFSYGIINEGLINNYGKLTIDLGENTAGTVNNYDDGVITFVNSGSNASQNDSSDAGGIGKITNNGSGSVIFQGGNERYSFGMTYNASNPKATGIITNNGSGSILFLGGSGEHSDGINALVNSSATSIVQNLSSGSMIIKGGSGAYSNGIGSVGWDGSGISSIINSGSGQILIEGGSGWCAYGIEYNGEYGSITEIVNTGEGNIEIKGGSRSTYGMYANSYNSIYEKGDSTYGKISNTGNGYILIQGSESASGMYANALQSDDLSSTYLAGQGIISNDGVGELIIKGSDSSDHVGLRYNAISTTSINGEPSYPPLYPEYDPLPAKGLIANTSSGTLKILGGFDSQYNYGLYVNAGNDAYGTISNTGNGDLIIQGYFSSSGIYSNAINGGYGLIENSGSGDLKILGSSDAISHTDGYGIDSNATSDSTGIIKNSGEGNITIAGGLVSIGILENSNGGKGIIENIGSGAIYIKGSNFYGSGLGINARDSGQGIIRNNGSGEIVISGGSKDPLLDSDISDDKFLEIGLSSHGLMVNALGSKFNEQDLDTTLGEVENASTGVMTIQGGEHEYTFGIAINALTGGKGVIRNGISGTLNIFGNKDAGSYGIGYLAAGKHSIALLENAGIMNLNANAIKHFSWTDSPIYGESGYFNVYLEGEPQSISVVNKSTGTVNAEVGAIFEDGGTTTTRTQKDITVVTSSVASNVNTDAYGTTTVTDEGWVLKDDWANHSVWEDGGKLTITDIADGTYDAQTIKEHFEEQFGTGTTISFTGEGGKAEGESSVTNDVFTMTVVNALISEGKAFDGSVVTSEVLDAENGAFSLAQSGTLSKNFGFKGISKATSVSVADGYALVLSGDAVDSASEFDLTDGAAVSVGNGRLVLGLNVAPYANYRGSLDAVTLNASSGQAVLEASAGEFAADKVNAVKNGLVSVAQNAKLTIADLDTDATSSVNVEKSGSLNLSGAAVIAGSVENAGSIDAVDTLTVSGNWTGAGTIANNKSISASDWTVANTINNATDNTVVTFASGTNTVGTIAGGKVAANADFSADALRNVKSLDVAASVEGQIDALAADFITNAGDLEVKSLTKTQGVDYTQTAGSISVADNWFANSTLNLNGGTLVRDSLGANTATVAGADVDLGSITSDTDFTLASGSVSADTISLTEEGKFTVSGGELSTGYSNIFTESIAEAVGLNVIGLESAQPEAVKNVLTEFFTRYIAGDVAESIAQNASFEGGKLVINVDHLSTTERDDLTAAFNKIFADTTVEFKGDISGVSEDSRLTVAKVNDLQKNVADLASVIYVDRKLQGDSAAVSVGGASGIGQSVGFAGIENTSSITVEGGRKLVLIGSSASDYAMTDAGATTSIRAGSALELGSLGLEKANTGTMGNVAMAGGDMSRANFTVVNGTYSMGALTGSRGNVRVDQGAAFTAASLELADSEITNAGTLTVTGDVSLDSTNLTNEERMTVAGNLELSGVLTNTAGAFLETNEMSVTGQLSNFGEIEASDTSTVYGTLENQSVIRLYDTQIGDRGALHNTATLTQTGTTTVNGLLSNLASGNAEMETVILDGENAVLENTGMLIVDHLIVRNGATASNGAQSSGIAFFAPRAGGTSIVGTLDVESDENYSNSGNLYVGQSTIQGNLINAEGGLAQFGVNQYFADGKGLTVTAEGSVDNDGSLILSGALSNAGKISGTGTVAFAAADGATNVFENTGSIEVSSVSASDTGADSRITINNSGTISADELSIAYADYTQTAGSASFDKGGFENSNVNLEGGSMSLEALGSGNAYTVGGSDAGTSSNLNVGTITSDSTLTIAEGGRVHVDTIDLTGSKTAHLLGGTLATTLDQIFADVDTHAHDIDAENPGDIVDPGVDVVVGVGDVIDSVAAGIEFGWGTVAFDDAMYSTSVAGDILAKLDAIDANDPSWGTLEVAFNGEASETFDVDTANRVQATDPEGGSTYAVFIGETLHNTTEANPGYTALYVGSAEQAAAAGVTDANILDNSIGFKQVVNVAGGMTVADARHFVLVGENQSTAGDFELIDGNLSIVRNGMLTLGSYAAQEATKGALRDVALSEGTLRVRHGSFSAQNVTSAGTVYIGGDGAEHGGAVLPEDTTSSFAVESFTAQSGSELINWGTFAVADLKTDGEDAGTLTNYGLLDVATAEVDMAVTNLKTAEFDALTLTGGSFVNGAQDAEDKAAATVTAATLALSAGSVFTNYGTTSADNGSIGGEFVNEAGASVTWDALSVADAGKLDNRGTAAAGSVTQTGGSIVNSGEFTLNSDAASSIGGSLNNTGSFTVEEGSALTIAENGSIVNSGSGTFNAAADISISGGTLTQDSTGAMTLGNVSIADGKLVVTSGKSVSGSGELSVNKTPGEAAVENEGSVEFGSINAAQGSITGTGTLVAESTLTVGENGSIDQSGIKTDSLANSGNITADNLTIAGSGDNSGQMSLSESLNGNLTNSGQLTIEGGENFTLAGGTLSNNGSFLAKENVTIDGGHFVQSSSMGAWFNDLTIKSGDVTVEAGKALHGFVGDTLTVDMGSAQDVAVVNDGSINYGSISVNQGKITGSGTFGTAGSQITVGESGSIEQGTVLGSSLANAGTITVDTINVSRGSNSGNLTAEDAVFTSAFDNRAEGEMNLNGSLEGSVNNEGTLTLGDGLEFASGTIENTGTLTGTGSITIAGGTIHQASDTEAVFGNVAINGGALNVEAGKSASGDALTVAMGSAEDVASVNNGTLDFESIGVDQGTITGSGTLGGETSSITVGVNGSVEQGSIIGSQINNEGLISGNVTAAAGSNTGTITAGDFTVGKGGQFVNAGTITTSGAADVANIDNRKEMTFGNGAAFSGGNVNTGTITVNGGKLTVATGDNATSGTGSLTVNAGLDVGADGKLTIEGPDASASITGGATIDGTFATSGNTTIDRIASESTGHIVAEGGKLHLGDLTDAEGMTFTQKTDTDLSLGKGWFENSTINIEGGKFDASIIKDDEGNSSGMLGHNTVNISGKNPTPIINSGDPSEEKIHYKDNLTVVTVETVTSDTTINIGSGGVLDVDNISLTPENDQASITLDGGVLETSLDQIFDYVATEAIKIENDETVFLPTEVLTATAVGEVKDEIASGLELGSGTIAFNDDYYSASAVISTALQLQNGFGEAASNVTTVFLGDMSGELTVDTVHDLEDEGLEDVLAGVILATETLQNTTAAEGAANTGLVIGGAAGESENQINVSIGFKDVAKADSVRIEGGKTFVLVGGERPADFDWTTGYGDGNKLLTDASDGGSVSVNNGRFELGTNGSANATVGWVNSTDISENGSMHVENGEFADWWIANEGKLTIASNGTLHTISITGSGSTVNDGTLTVGTDANEGTLEVGTGGFVNNGTLDATHVADTVVAGDLFNEGRAEYDDMTITAGGSSVNEGYERGDILTVESGASHSNTGISIWNDMTIASGASGSNGKPLADDAPKGHEEGFASDALLQVGTDAADETFDISGSFDNHGVLDADAMETTLVAGDLFNEGQAVYNDMTVVNGGSSVNEGYEKGDILTVEGGASHSNTGVSIWNNIQISEGGSGSNGNPLAPDAPKGHEEGFDTDSFVTVGTDNPDEEFRIDGSFDNHGGLDATETETTTVTGDLFNDGQARYDDMTITAGGSSDNDGYERGDILTVEDGGTHDNSGISIWNNIQITEGGSGENSGDLTLGDKDSDEDGSFEIGGDFTNTEDGTLDATDVPETIVGGDLTNDGNANYDDMHVDGGNSENNGREEGDILTVDNGGTHTNTGESIWNNITVGDGGKHTNKGTESADEIVIDGGIYEVADGTTVGDNVTINSGDLVIGNKLELSPDNEAEFIMKKPNPINGHVWVIGNGHLGVGDGSDTFGGEMGAAGLPEAPARVTVTAPVTIGEGSLAVGQGTYTDPDNKLQLGNGDLYFAEDSYTLISAGAVNEETAAFTGTVDGAKVTVEEGATLVLGNINNTGKYLITSGFDTTGNSEEGTWLGGWLDEDNLFALPQDGSGLGWDLKLDFSDDEIWVIADLDDVTTVYPDISIPDITNDDMDQNKPEDKGDEFIQDTLRDEDLSVEEKTKIINSVAEIGFAGGAHSTAFDDMGAATDAIENRVSFGGSHFDGSGTLIRDVHGASVWVDVLGGTRKTKNLEASGRMEGGSDVDSYGFVFGTDYVTASQSAVFGAAFSYSKGDVESSGDWLKTMSDTESYGLHLYGAWTPNERFNVVGTLAYQWSQADISQTIGAAGFGSASADIDTQFVSAGVRGEYRWQVKDGLAVIPHAGLRALYGMTDGYDTKVDGQKAFGNDADNTLTFQMPIGVALRADYLTASGWNWRGTGDISVIPQFGDTEQDVTVYNSRNVDDVITGEFTGNFVTRAKLGFEATKGMTTFGLDYGFATGDSIESHQINAKIRFVF